ncbi:hypothetical protein EI94DRAFT_1707051 [Lactarius quietus]|nr:hypothetical protein EI94DRAFT_1707051 [Lactarius quietus]
MTVHRSSAGIWRQVSTAALFLVDKDSPIADYIGVTNKDEQPGNKFDLVHLEKSANHDILGTCVLDKCELCPYDHTEMARLFPALFSGQTFSCRRGISITLVNGDLCRLDSWVLFKSEESGARVPALGHIKEIVVHVVPATTATEQTTRTAVLLQHADIGAYIEPYRMPVISFGNKWVVVDISTHHQLGQHILCAANIQHRCHDHQCTASGSVQIYQEQQLTERTQALVQHRAPHDLVLNTARMHDGAHFNFLRACSHVNHDEISTAIIHGAQQEVDGRKRQ